MSDFLRQVSLWLRTAASTEEEAQAALRRAQDSPDTEPEDLRQARAAFDPPFQDTED